jgi:hypothetical protein
LTSADSDIGESPRKRSHAEEDDEDAPAIEEDEEEAEPSTETAEQVEETPIPDTLPPGPVKLGRGKKGRPKTKKPDDAEPEPEPIEEPTEVEEEQVEEDPIKAAEALQHKQEASSLYEGVAKQFRAFKDKLYTERLATLTSELQLLSQPECLHPEYARQVACVDARLKKQISEAHAFYNYRMRSIREVTLGERSQLHSQHYQQVREFREDVLDELGVDWYAIQKERRSSYEVDDDRYLYLFQTKRSKQIRQQAKYNQEVSILAGMAKYVGFPAAPELGGAPGDGVEDDLRAMKVRISRIAPCLCYKLTIPLQISKRPPLPTAIPQQQPPPPQRPVYLPTAAGPPPVVQSEQSAHDQFIERNPWARSQAPIHHAHPHAHSHAHGITTPGISHTPDWAADPTSTNARNLLRDLSGQVWRNAVLGSSPLGVGPAVGSRISNIEAGDAPPPPVSAAERIGLLNHINNGGGANLPNSSPLTTAAPRPRIDGPQQELTGFRNISGISGTSTIDAPPSSSPRQAQEKPAVPELTSQVSAPQQVFDTSQLHMHRHQENGNAEAKDRRDVYPNPDFRVKEGDFGTPAPVPASTGTVLGPGPS